MAALEPAFKRTVLENEGPYDNNPSDPGGETIYGITRKYQRSWQGWERFDAVVAFQDLKTNEQKARLVSTDERMQRAVLDFYERGPWAAIRGCELESQAIAEELFDAAVNCGTVTVIKWLQRALNVFNRQGRDYPDVEVDGYLGNQTLEALNALVKRNGESLILKALNAQQGMRYIELAEKNPELEQFEVGWWARRIS